jgi:hypothetical protein
LINHTPPSISTTVRRSRQLNDGSWVAVEMTASRTVHNENPDDDIKDARVLAAQLDREVIDALAAKKARTIPTQVEAPPDGLSGHWVGTPHCDDHGVDFEKRSNADGEWFSHIIDGTEKWCNRRYKR